MNSSQQQFNIHQNIVSIFLDIASREISKDELIRDSLWSNSSNSYSLKKINIQQQLECCSESELTNIITYKQLQDDEYFKQKKISQTKHNQQQNIIKNILKNFSNYLIKLQDINTKQKYEQMYSKKAIIPFSEIKKLVSKKLNINNNRWNFQLRSILESQRLKPILYDYLINQSKSWLSNSKVSNINEHQKLINLIINSIENNEPLEIKIYKKKK
ncbi:hypothetical protein ABPG74_001595 [Tetrahymena malaccensis]